MVSFGLATEVSEDFVNFPIDGIMGLGFPDGSRQKVRTIMDELVDNGLIKAKLFGLALSRRTDAVNDAVINFGGIDSGLFEGSLSFSSSVSDDGLWELQLDNASVDGNTFLPSGRTAVIDSGTSLVHIPFFFWFILDFSLTVMFQLASRSTPRRAGTSLHDSWCRNERRDVCSTL